MRDVAARIKRYRLARYRTDEPKTRRALMRLLLVALCVWLAYQVVASDHGLVKISSTKTEIRQLAQEEQQLLAEKKNLGETLKLYENNPFLLEKALRDQMGLVRDGELVYRFDEQSSGGSR
jgi:cell division protein FtsB